MRRRLFAYREEEAQLKAEMQRLREENERYKRALDQVAQRQPPAQTEEEGRKACERIRSWLRRRAKQ